MPAVKEREARSMEVLTAVSEDAPKLIDSRYYVEGYALTFDRYKLWGEGENAVYEQFRKEDFADTDMSDVIMQYDHSGRVTARQSNGTLKLILDDKGLKIGADLSKTDAAEAMYRDITSGMINRMSWRFVPEGVHFDEKTRTFTYDRIVKIYDVSAVSIPANDNTVIAARAAYDESLKALKKRENDRQRLRLRLKLIGIETGEKYVE